MHRPCSILNPSASNFSLTNQQSAKLIMVNSNITTKGNQMFYFYRQIYFRPAEKCILRPIRRYPDSQPSETVSPELSLS